MAHDAVLADRLRVLLEGEEGITEKPMFGGIAFLIDDNMAVSASGEGGLLLRVDPTETAELVARPNGRSCVMGGKTMQGWIRVDIDGRVDPDELRSWVAIGTAYARSLPPK